MDRQAHLCKSNRINLVRSAPSVYVEKTNTSSDVHHRLCPLEPDKNVSALPKRELQHQNKDVSPVSKRPILARPKLTVVSPMKKFRLPIFSSTDFTTRSTADGESSTCSTVDNEDKISCSFPLRHPTDRYPGDRYPGDGCTSDSDENDDSEDDGVFDDSTDKLSDNGIDNGLTDDVSYMTSINTFDEEEFPDIDAYEG